jgi:4-hydroxymandelate oxidase
MTEILKPLNQIPADIHCAQDYKLLARHFIAAPSYEYIAGGSGRDVTLNANHDAFASWAIYPRLLRDVTAGHTRLNLLGHELPHPILLAPVAFQKLAHPLGELETARAASAMQSCLITSTLSSHSLEDIAHNAGIQRWFQLYFQPQREVTLDLIRRAEAAGYGAIVVTLDASIQLPSLRSLRAGFQMPADCVAANLTNYATPAPITLDSHHSRIFQGAMNDAPTWDDLDWLLTQTTLPIWIKGVVHPDDASALKTRGISGVIVSNHGGRTLDGAPASLHALPIIRAAVGADYPLLFDSGIRSGSDIFKALALGANAVLIGRLQMYALSVAGALGVAHMLRLLREELEICMALAGCATLTDIRRTALTPVISQNEKSNDHD